MYLTLTGLVCLWYFKFIEFFLFSKSEGAHGKKVMLEGIIFTIICCNIFRNVCTSSLVTWKKVNEDLLNIGYINESQFIKFH